jgi:hypothetical protein
MNISTLSYFLKALDFFFTDSGGLLPNSTTLVKTLLTGQLPSKKLAAKKPGLRLRMPGCAGRGRFPASDVDSMKLRAVMVQL